MRQTDYYPLHGQRKKQNRNKRSCFLLFLQVFLSRFSLRMMSDSSCLIISSATPRSHDQGAWQHCWVMRLPVPMLMGEKLMGVFSLPVLHSSLVLLEWGPATWATPKPPYIDLQESNYLPGKKGLSNHFAYNAALDPPQAACVHVLYF